jgi:hypothetical protein
MKTACGVFSLELEGYLNSLEFLLPSFPRLFQVSKAKAFWGRNEGSRVGEEGRRKGIISTIFGQRRIIINSFPSRNS